MPIYSGSPNLDYQKEDHPSTQKRTLNDFKCYFRNGSVEVTPVLRILVAIGCGLALVAVSLIIVLKVRPAFVRRKREAGDGMSSRATSSYAPGTHIPLSQRDIEEEVEEKDPDVIPVNKGAI